MISIPEQKLNSDSISVKIRKFVKKNATLLALLVYLTLGLYLLPWYQFRLNPDGISYISIAEKYARGDWSQAINGYWGPLYSILLSIVSIVIANPLISAKVLSLLIGCALILALQYLAKVLSLSPYLRWALLAASGCLSLFFAFAFITADILLISLQLLYIAMLLDKKRAPGTARGLVIGVISGFAYWSKAFAFPFFLVHHSLFHAILYRRTAEKRDHQHIKKQYWSALAVFAFMSAIWIGLISCKYEKVVIGTAGNFDWPTHLMEYNGLNPMYFVGFMPPPNGTAPGIWEDPSYLAFELSSPSARSNWQLLLYHSKILVHNAYDLLLVLLGRWNTHVSAITPGSLLLLCLLALWFYGKKGTLPEARTSRFLLLTIAIYCAGYVLLLIDERFIWFPYLLLVVLNAYWIDRLFFTAARLRRQWRIIVALSFFVLAGYRPIFSLFHMKDTGKNLFELAEILRNDYHVSGRLVSDSNWDHSFIVAYHAKMTYYGRVAKKKLQRDLVADLEKYDIDYMLVWNAAPACIRDKQEVLRGRWPGLELYRLKTDHSTNGN
jgi:hypothetical protein